jgi:hypothetical protein
MGIGRGDIGRWEKRFNRGKEKKAYVTGKGKKEDKESKVKLWVISKRQDHA